MIPFRSIVASQMVRAHKIHPELAEYHVSKMRRVELLERFKKYAGMELSAGAVFAPAALALPESAESRTNLGETEGHGLLPLRAIALRSPSGGGGGGAGVDFDLAVEVCREAENQVCSGGRRVPAM